MSEDKYLEDDVRILFLGHLSERGVEYDLRHEADIHLLAQRLSKLVAMRARCNRDYIDTDTMPEILEAAAPYIAAAAYEADAKAFRSCKSRNPFEWYVSRVMASLFESRAARIRSRA